MPSIKPSRALRSGLIGAWDIWSDPRCQSHHCLNALRGAAAEIVAQVETGHGEPGGKTQSSGRGPSLARQLGCWHAHAATAAMDWSEECFHEESCVLGQKSWASTVGVFS